MASTLECQCECMCVRTIYAKHVRNVFRLASGMSSCRIMMVGTDNSGPTTVTPILAPGRNLPVSFPSRSSNAVAFPATVRKPLSLSRYRRGMPCPRVPES
eukprot:898964-Rhodomonas_salina.3